MLVKVLCVLGSIGRRDIMRLRGWRGSGGLSWSLTHGKIHALIVAETICWRVSDI